MWCFETVRVNGAPSVYEGISINITLFYSIQNAAWSAILLLVRAQSYIRIRIRMFTGDTSKDIRSIRHDMGS